MAHPNQERTRKETDSNNMKSMGFTVSQLLLRVRSVSFFYSCFRRCCESTNMHYAFSSSSLFPHYNPNTLLSYFGFPILVKCPKGAPAAPVAVLLAPTCVVPCLFSLYYYVIPYITSSSLPPFPPSLASFIPYHILICSGRHGRRRRCRCRFG